MTRLRLVKNTFTLPKHIVFTLPNNAYKEQEDKLTDLALIV